MCSTHSLTTHTISSLNTVFHSLRFSAVTIDVQTNRWNGICQTICMHKRIITQNSSSESRKLRCDLFLFYCRKFEQWIQATAINSKNSRNCESMNFFLFFFVGLTVFDSAYSITLHCSSQCVSNIREHEQQQQIT